MGQTAAETRAEIEALRREMGDRVAGIRKAVQRPLRVARVAALTTVVVVVVGGVALVAYRARRRSERESFRGRAEALGRAVVTPKKTVQAVDRKTRKAASDAREALKEKLREEVRSELKDQRPMYEKVLTGAATAAASAAVPVVLRQLQARIGGPNGSTTSTAAPTGRNQN
jgi:hypothetical protein